ncbi:MAG: DndE family protein [Flavipsychrobacter sp.]|nr:DndE family protein [Flavipsychrobacter sp.]
MKKIKTSEVNRNTVLNFTKKFDFRDDRTVGQIAIAYSIQLNTHFDVDNDKPCDNNGKEYPESFLGEINRYSNDVVYHAILNQHYNRKLTEEQIQKLLKLHLDHGLETLQRTVLQTNKGKNAHIDFLLNVMERGLVLLDFPKTKIRTNGPLKNANSFEGRLKVELGKDAKTGEKVVLDINDENQFDSQHFAVAGMNGSGKTELVKDILFQLRQQSQEKLNFIFFDYKGEGKSSKLKKFLEATNSEFVDIRERPFLFNPLRNINISNDRDRTFGIKAFKDTVASIDSRIGVKQQNCLENVMRKCFEKTAKTGDYPSLRDVSEALSEYYDESKMKPDTLSSIMSELGGEIFATDFDPNYKLQEKSLYINLPTSLGDTVRQAAVFLMLNYLLNEFTSYNDVVTTKERLKPIRYVIVIDEAHAYLSNKNMSKVLENLLRMVRSKGVIIMMLTQGIEEYKRKEFDFTSQIKIPILLNVQNKDVKVARSLLGTPKNEAVLKSALTFLGKNDDDKKFGVINVNDPTPIEINQFWKRTI